MTDSAGPSVTGSQEQVHTGTGHIFNFNRENPASLLADLKGKSPRVVAADQLAWLHQRFVHPPGFGDARDYLKRKGTVLLDGKPGSGRNAAARILLYERRDDAGTFHEVETREEGRPRLDPEIVGAGDQLLLNLSGADERLWSEVQDELATFRSTVVERQAHLVVTLPYQRATRLHTDLIDFRVEIGRGPGMDVLQSYLRKSGIPVSETLQPVPALSEHLDNLPPMREIAELAALIETARRRAREQGSFSDWCEHALNAVRDRAGQVAALLAELPSGRQRALLLTTAMLSGAHADDLHHATDQLLRTVNYPKDETPLLERADLAERFAQIKAEADADGTVRFIGLGYDAAVRAHFWNHVPDLRARLREWVGHAVESGRLAQRGRDLLIERFAEQWLRTGPPQALVALVERWTATTRWEPRLRAAAQVLEYGLKDERHGAFFRSAIYNWSGREGLTDELTQVLVGVCAEVLALSHPEQAMVRLHHLARRQREKTTAFEALLVLVRRDHWIRRRMLHRLERGLTSAKWQVDARLFLELSDPALLVSPGPRRAQPLLPDGVVRSQLAAGWAGVFRLLPQHEWNSPLSRWLFAACENDQYSDVFLDVLVAGAAHRPDILGALYTTARDWAAAGADSREDRAEVTARLLHKIGAAQRRRAAAPSL
ncbi:hypothetical protein [Streptomyces sp. NPDC056672]|uniref:hypothetical protein n=1 Tax=Streptomyces sp. NPDC056672 TaxID=3345906 RepID=UPI0036B3782E